METWRPIPGSSYEASSLGRIRSPRGNILKLHAHTLGYQIVDVRFDNEPKTKTRTVHSLVALAFHGPRPEGLDVAHGNCIKTDNRPSNLRYATRSENLIDSYVMGHFLTAYPWRRLQVGDTFATSPNIRAKSAYEYVAKARKRMGHDYTVSANDDGSWTVTRVA
nr:NUMOD4 motif-containing HNH endonuclease [uncultured Brevundimonas sp.]